MHVFLSFAGEYRDLADRLAVGLAQEGHTVFFDRDDLPPGKSYDAAIRRELDRTDLVVFLIAPESLHDGAYALSELKYVRQRWRNPSGRVLPVMVEPVPFDEIPSYLSAVTVLQSRANLVADVLAAIEKISHRRRVPRPILALLFAVIVAAAVSWWLFGREDGTASPVCYLWIEPSDMSRLDEVNALRLTLAIRHAGRTNSFILSEGGRTPFQLDVDRHDPWTLELIDWQGNTVGAGEVSGCPRESTEIPLDENTQMVVRPRVP